LLPDVVVLLAGKELDRDYVATLRKLVDAHQLANRVFFVGEVTDIAAFLSEVDVFCLTTLASGRQEALGVALLEAMASGRACIATDVSGPRDIVRHGIDGLLVPPAQPDVLAFALRECSDPTVRARLGAAARERVLEHFTIEREVADHVALYQELVGR
jgi:glycosyltransferase involved in cell wall biosynthesis